MSDRKQHTNVSTQEQQNQQQKDAYYNQPTQPNQNAQQHFVQPGYQGVLDSQHVSREQFEEWLKSQKQESQQHQSSHTSQQPTSQSSLTLQQILHPVEAHSLRVQPQEVFQRLGFPLKYPMTKLPPIAPNTSERIMKQIPTNTQSFPTIPNYQLQQMALAMQGHMGIKKQTTPTRGKKRKTDDDDDEEEEEQIHERPIAKRPRIEIPPLPPRVKPVWKVPDNVVEKIFTFLPVLPYYYGCRRVCKKWNEILSADKIWDNVEHFNFSGFPMDRIEQEDIDYFFQAAKNMKKLTFSDAMCDDALVKSFDILKDNLEVLVMGFCEYENTSNFITQLASMPKLHTFILCCDLNEIETGFTKEQFKTLIDTSKSLKTLSYEWSKWDENDLKEIQQYCATKNITFTYSKRETFDVDPGDKNYKQLQREYGERVLALFKRTQLNTNTISFIDILIEHMDNDFDFFAKALPMGLNPSVIITGRQKDTMLHLVM